MTTQNERIIQNLTDAIEREGEGRDTKAIHDLKAFAEALDTLERLEMRKKEREFYENKSPEAPGNYSGMTATGVNSLNDPAEIPPLGIAPTPGENAVQDSNVPAPIVGNPPSEHTPDAA